jgi:O-antigen ligase
MPPSAERIGWALVAAGALASPVIGLVAAGLLVAGQIALAPGESARRGRALLRAWPPALWWAVAALAGVHALRGAVAWDLPALLGWGAALAVARPRHAGAARDGVLLGTAAGVALQVGAAVVAALTADGWGRVSGTTPHPNLLGAAMLLAAATLALASAGAGGWRLAVARPALVAALGLALASGSRAAVVGAAVAAAGWAFATLATGAAGPGRARRRRVALALLAAAAVAPLALAAVRGLPAAGLLTDDVERAELFSVALDLAAARPVLGHGGDPWVDLVAAAEPALPAGLHPHAHSVALHLLVRGGAVGWALATLLVGLAAWALRRPLLAVLTGPLPAAPLLAAAIGGLLLQGFVDLTVVDPTVYLGAAALLAVLPTAPRRYHPPS